MRTLHRAVLAIAAVAAVGGVATGVAPPAAAQSAALSCLDPVIYPVDASVVRTKLPPVCIAVGGVLRLVNLGPGGLAAVTPANKVDCFYGGGVHTCRLIGTGTVRFSLTGPQGNRQQTVEVAARATRPGYRSACSGYDMVTRDAGDTGMGWESMCLYTSIPLRFTNLGSGALTISPANAADCWDQDDGHYCMPNRTGPIRFTLTRPGAEDASLTAVVID